MAEFPALTLWTDAYLSDTRFLTTVEHGAYLLLLMEAWRRPHCDLPDDDKILARISGLSLSEWGEIKETILAFWKHDKRRKVFVQKRLTLERDRARTRSRSQANKAAKRWNKKESDDAAAMHRQSRGNASTATATATATIDDSPNGLLSTGGPDDPSPEQFELEVQGDDPPVEAPLTPQDILETWNDFAPQHGLPVVRGALSKARQQSCAARIREHPDREVWAIAFRAIAERPWMHGDNERGWRADFDFLIQAKSFTKLIEGSYGKN